MTPYACVDVCGDPADLPVLAGPGQAPLAITHEGLENVTIRSLRFKNVSLVFNGATSYATTRNLTFRSCEFLDGRSTKDWEGMYLSFGYVDDVTVEQCSFLRSSKEVGGRGVGVYRSHHVVVRDSYFGTTRDLEPAQTHGFFRTAVNVYGNNEDGSLRPVENKIVGNVARRASQVCPADVACQDHGMYVRSFYLSQESLPWGIHAGDFDGDGRTDLVYRGRCGPDAGHPCWRVHRSTGTAFVPSDWGDEAYFAADSRHLGLVVTDIDGDQRSDLGYRGACGAGALQWRYHRSTGAGFVVQCSEHRLHGAGQ